MKISDTLYSPYRPASLPKPPDFEEMDVPLPTGIPAGLAGQSGGGAARADAGTEPATTLGSSSTISLSAAFWALSAEKLESRAAAAEKAAQAAAASSASDKAATRQDFMDWSSKSVAEKIRAQILSAHDLSEEALAKMDPEAIEAIEKEIAEAILQQAGIAANVEATAAASSPVDGQQTQDAS